MKTFKFITHEVTLKIFEVSNVKNEREARAAWINGVVQPKLVREKDHIHVRCQVQKSDGKWETVYGGQYQKFMANVYKDEVPYNVDNDKEV